MKGRSSEKHKQSESGRIGFDVWVRLMWTAQCSVLKQSCVWRGEEGGREMPQQAEDDEMGVGSCPLLPRHRAGGRWILCNLSTSTSPLYTAGCVQTHTHTQQHTNIKHTLTLADAFLEQSPTRTFCSEHKRTQRGRWKPHCRAETLNRSIK